MGTFKTIDEKVIFSAIRAVRATYALERVGGPVWLDQSVFRSDFPTAVARSSQRANLGNVTVLKQARDDLAARAEHITTLCASTDPDDVMEFLMLQTTIQSRLDAPIPAGKRNNTLFAIGAEMKIAGITGWSEQVYNRAVQVGLADEEAAKLVANIDKYGDRP